MQKVWKCDLHIIDSHTRHLSVIYVLWRRAISPSHFYPIKACNVCREYCKCTDCSVCSCWKHWFLKNLLLRQLRTAVLLGWERWLYLWPDFEVSEQQHSTFAHFCTPPVLDLRWSLWNSRDMPQSRHLCFFFACSYVMHLQVSSTWYEFSVMKIDSSIFLWLMLCWKEVTEVLQEISECLRSLKRPFSVRSSSDCLSGVKSCSWS